MNNKIIFEQPLNERMRNFLRLEHLFSLMQFRSVNDSQWDFRNILESLLRVIDLLSRSDLKAELIKELERHANILLMLKNNPAVDQPQLESFNSDTKNLLKILKDKSYQPGLQLKQDDLAINFKQRISIPDGTCKFDLPRFNHWLHQPISKCKQDIHHWKKDLEPICKATAMILNMVRNSTKSTDEKAKSGFYQKPIESNTPCQIIRVLLPSDSPCYPEISGGRHRFTIRFMEAAATNTRPEQTKNDIDFELNCCIL